MNTPNYYKVKVRQVERLLLACIIMFFSFTSLAQTPSIQVDLSAIDGLDLVPANIFNYRIDNRSGHAQQAEVTGQVHYRRSALSFSYRYSITLQPGINQISKQLVPSPSWIFSEQPLRELFFNYNRLPQGTYEYCVGVAIRGSNPEGAGAGEPEACVYQTANDIFLINLLDPEDDAKIYEYNPMLSWVVNYPFASELTYRIRVAEQKQGQNKQNAITRNNAMYQDNHVMSTGTVYPVTARPLVKNQPYVWAVDAYYKGILLGGSEVWRFTIIEDSIDKALPSESFYVDIRKENNNSLYYAVGQIKLKYVLDEKNEEIVRLTLRSDGGKEISLKSKEVKMILGDNRLDINLKEEVRLKHMGKYTLAFSNSSGEVFYLPFKYINPELIK